MRAALEQQAHYGAQTMQVGQITHLRLSGILDETFSPKAIASQLIGQCVIDLGHVQRISSFGVRQWMELSQTLPPGVLAIYLVNVPPMVVDQLNLVEGFSGVCTVLSMLAPYRCPGCNAERLRPVALHTDGAVLATGGVPAHTCPVCQKSMVFADNADEFFHFARTHPVQSVDPGLARFLALTSPVTAPDVPASVKLVVGDITFVRFASRLKGDLSVRRLAGGLEGRACYDFGGVTQVDTEAVPRLMEVLRTAATSARVFLWRTPPAVLAALAKAQPIPKVAIATLWLPVECKGCGSRVHAKVPSHQYLTQKSEDSKAYCQVCGTAIAVPRYRELGPLLRATQAEDAPMQELEELEVKALGKVLSADKEDVQKTPTGTGSGGSAGRLQILRRIGQGGMAEVFLARQQGIKGFEKYLCLKKVTQEFAKSPEFVELLFAEARASARLSHPNVVQIFDVGMMEGAAYITMEYVRGPDLKRVLNILRKAGKPLPLEHAMRIGAEVATGLHYAHSYVDPAGNAHPLIHRDVSPHNVLVSLDGAVKISDFGIAKMANEAEEIAKGAFKGKVPYCSPEAVRGQELDARADVFSLGICLFEMLIGRLPFRGENDAATLRMILKEATPPLRQLRADVPEDVEAIINRALAKDVDSRYQSAAAVRDDLESALARNGLHSSPADVARFCQETLGETAAEFMPAGRDGPALGASSTLPSMTPSHPSLPALSQAGAATGTPSRGPASRPGSASGVPRLATPAGVSPSVAAAATSPSDPNLASLNSGEGATMPARPGARTDGTPSRPGSSAGVQVVMEAQSAMRSGATPPPVKGATPPPFRPPGSTPSPSLRSGGTPSPLRAPGGTPAPFGATPRPGTNSGVARPGTNSGISRSGISRSGISRSGVSATNAARPAAPEPPPKKSPVVALVIALVVVGVGAGAFFALRKPAGQLSVSGLAGGERVYINGQRVEVEKLAPTDDPVMVAVARDGKLLRLGSVRLEPEMDFGLLVDASAASDATAEVTLDGLADGCNLLLGGAPAKPPSARIAAGKEVQAELGCNGVPKWSGWVLAAPGQRVKLNLAALGN